MTDRNPRLAAELDVAAYYLLRRIAPTSSSPIHPEHFSERTLGEAWRRSADGEGWNARDFLAADTALHRALVDHVPPMSAAEIRRAEDRLVREWRLDVLCDACDRITTRRSRDLLGQTELGVTPEEVEQEIGEALSHSLAGSLRRSESAADVRARIIHRALERWAGRSVSMLIPIGIHCIQRDIGGFLRGKLHVWGAPTSGHKTTIARTLASFSGRHKFRTLYLPLEDVSDEIETRSIAAESHGLLSRRQIYSDRRPVQEEAERLIASVDESPTALRYLNASRVTLDRLVSIIRAEFMHGLDVVFIDHLHRIRPRRRGDLDHWIEVADTLAELASELNVAVIAMGQLDKPGQAAAASGGYPTMESLRFGTALVQPARTVWMIHRMRAANERPTDARALAVWQAQQDGLTVLKIACEKNTNGPLGTWLVTCNAAYDQIGDEI